MSTRPSLDKSHGFMKFIITNQKDRDSYEKEQNELQRKRDEERKMAKMSPKAARSRRREQAFYKPPHLRISSSPMSDKTKETAGAEKKPVQDNGTKMPSCSPKDDRSN